MFEQIMNLADLGYIPVARKVHTDRKGETSFSYSKGFTSKDFGRGREDIPRFLAATANADPILHQIIMLGAYTGCRYAELANLTKANLKSDHMVITDAKTKAGNRDVPLHHKIAELIHRLAQESTSDFVIDGLLLKDKGRRGAEVGVRFGKLKKSMGFRSRVHSFHSIRKTVMTILEQSGANPIAVNRLLGWTIGGEGYGTYSGGASMKQLKDTVNLIDYSEL